MTTAISGLSGAPTLVEVRKSDVLHPGDSKTAAIIVPQHTAKTVQTTGGSVVKAYTFWVSIYRETQGDVSTGTDTNPALVLLAKQALDVDTLSGASTVFMGVLVDDSSWENQEFAEGVEKSMFGVMYLSCEPRNG